MSSRQARSMDMLNGPLAGKILMFAIPLALSSILQQLFNAVDVAVVGHFASDPAIATAAVGCNGPVINMIINLFVGISVGANVVVSNCIGSGNEEKARSAAHSSMLLAAICGILILFIGLAVSEPVLTLMDTPEEIFEHPKAERTREFLERFTNR